MHEEMSMSERLIEAIEPHTVFTIKAFGLNIPVKDVVVVMWIIMAFLVIASIVLTRKLTVVPGKRQTIAEIVVETINNMVKDAVGAHHWKPFAPFLGTVVLFLIFANTAAIFNIVPGFHIRPPTRNINVTVSLAVISIVTVNIAGIKYKKFGGWLKSFVEPTPIMLPFKILEVFIKPTSLALRLFGNILGAFIVMELLYMAMPIFVPAIFSFYFDLFDGILQAYVFMFLTSLYIAEAVE